MTQWNQYYSMAIDLDSRGILINKIRHGALYDWMEEQRNRHIAKTLSDTFLHLLRSLDQWNDWESRKPFRSHTQSQIDKSEEVFVRKRITNMWEDMRQILLIIPENIHIHKNLMYKDEEIGAWFENCQTRYKLGTISPERDALLSESIHWRNWKNFWRNRTFPRQNRCFEAYFIHERQGSTTSPVIVDGVNVSAWIYKQRSHYVRGIMSKSMLKRLRTSRKWNEWEVSHNKRVRRCT